MSQDEFETLLAFFKALANASRLKIIGVLADREASVGELATLLSLREPTISHHLSTLRGLGLVTMRTEGTVHLYRLCTDELERMARKVLSPGTLATGATQVDGDAWDRKVLSNFFEGETLKLIPASRKKREVILRWLRDRFEVGKQYPEREVNEILKRHHPDCATLRRELVGAGWLKRERGIYWRVEL